LFLWAGANPRPARPLRGHAVKTAACGAVRPHKLFWPRF